jgi:hypothetical protein
VLDGDQDPPSEVAVAGVLNVTADREHGNVLGCRVEVAGDDDAGIGVPIQDLVDEAAYL